MIGNTILFTINVTGDAQNVVNNIQQSFEGLNSTVSKTTGFIGRLSAASLGVNQITTFLQNFSDTLNNAIEPGIKFDHSLRELSAIAQVSGKELTTMGKSARQLSKDFGGDAHKYVESFKDVVGSLGDAFADSTALDMMGRNVATLSKLMDGDAKAAAEALTTAMLQYGVDLKNPTAAAEEAARMMNVMQAAANVGGSEVKDTALALRQSGLLAHQSGLSFEELNASLEGLAKGKIVASEAGVAMRNMLLSMSTLETAPKDVIEGLQKYGVNAKLVADPTAKFTDRLRELKKIQGDVGLMESVFLKSNIAAGQTLLNNIDIIDEWTEQITDTQAAVEGAGVVMESYQERLGRVQARFDNLKISLFNVTGSLGLWAKVVADSLVPIAQIVPLVQGMGALFSWIKTINYAGAMDSIRRSITRARIAVAWMNKDLATNNMVHLGFIGNTIRATIALGRFATVGVWNAVKGIGAYIASLVTGGATSAMFSAVASASFATVGATAVAAFKAITTAIFNIPVLGWVLFAIAALGTLFVWLYKKVDGFRAVIQGIGAAIKALFKGESVSDAYNNAYTKTLDEAARKRAEEADREEAERLGMSVADYQRISKEAKEKGVSIEEYMKANPHARFGDMQLIDLDAQGLPPDLLNKTEATVTGGTRNTAITVNIGSMVESISFTENLKSSSKELEALVLQQITKALLAAQSIG